MNLEDCLQSYEPTLRDEAERVIDLDIIEANGISAYKDVIDDCGDRDQALLCACRAATKDCIGFIEKVITEYEIVKSENNGLRSEVSQLRDALRYCFESGRGISARVILTLGAKA